MGLFTKKKKPHKTRDGKIALTLRAQNIDLIIDIGANKGQSRDLYREHGFTGEIISLDPVPSLQDILQAKAKKDPHWSVLPPLALGDKNGEIEFNVCDEATDLSSILPSSESLKTALPNAKNMHSVKVEMKTLDRLFEELEISHNISSKKIFIKIDAQGAEKMILESGQKALEKTHGLQVEMSLFPLYEGEALYDELLQMITKAGFQPHMLVETNFSRRLNRQLQIDGIFYKDV